MSGRRVHVRFTLPATWEGSLRMLHDVASVQRAENGELIAVTSEPGVLGEILLLDFEEGGRDVNARVRVLESRPMVVDGAVRYQLRLARVPIEENGGSVGVLTREVQVSMLNFSHSGCLLESRIPLTAGTVGTMRVAVSGAEYVEDVQVLRCQEVAGGGDRYHVGVRFLWASLARKWALSRSMSHHVGKVSAWLSERQVQGDAT